jgi:hypothetical protein
MERLVVLELEERDMLMMDGDDDDGAMRVWVWVGGLW